MVGGGGLCFGDVAVMEKEVVADGYGQSDGKNYPHKNTS